MDINIKDAYLMNFNTFILLVSYTPGLELSHIINFFKNDLNMKTLILNTDSTPFPDNTDFINFDDLNYKINKEIHIKINW